MNRLCEHNEPLRRMLDALLAAPTNEESVGWLIVIFAVMLPLLLIAA